MRHARRAAIAALVLTTLIASAGTAQAVAPGNDLYGGRTVVGAVPFTDSLDTTEATTDTDDAELNVVCGAPATDASVWYEITPTATGGLAADVSSSTYSAGAIVATGSPGNWTLVACGPGAVAWSADAGTTYTILVFDDQFDGGGNGGTLNLTIDVIPPPPTVDITVNGFASFNNKTGAVTLTGTATCTGEPDFTFVEASLTQQIGRFTLQGFGLADILCDGTTRPWSVDIFSETGKFSGGKAATVTFAIACGPFECGTDFEEHTIQLRGKP
ncbi:hypothetical protein EV643_10947 [Kribbella sp. VKM Ac-2527]|uniref:DUF6299 domain-containing protein n=1 Tax=Kribbella caucasensis TaxID=2512215 RepID=A0A4R6KB48_9ACTN|nr:DUF6299 family protein [Kribbella sp. VKM Ac-2527]TDO47156.1 hypothetical protein EV643_10947 [Kribbella sp. VKM Ac-2527]